jgi:tRNA dimethylallyltransferase
VGTYPTNKQPPLVAIVGPTATGKSDLAVALARRFGGEVINADSRQFYAGMEIGVATPPRDQRRRVPHHLYAFASPAAPLGLARWLDMARQLIVEAQSRGALPIVVGGTGQYVWALLEGWDVPRAGPAPELRARLEQDASRQGAEALHARLRELDPAAAASIDPRNTRRVVRALEFHAITGRRFSDARSKTPPPFCWLTLGLTTPARADLHARIDARVDAMLAAGWLEEVRALIAAGYKSSPVFQGSLGYPELARVLEGEITARQAAAAIKSAHHQLARRQYAWFRPADPRIAWLTIGEGDINSLAGQEVARFLGGAPRN